MTVKELEALDKPGQSACLINGRLGWLPTDEQMEAYFAAELIEDDALSFDDNWLTADLPATSYQPVGEAAEYGLGRGIDY